MRVVFVRPELMLTSSRRLFDALELAFPVRFEPWREGARPDGVLIADSEALPALEGVPVLVLARDGDGGETDAVRIDASSAVDRRLHALELSAVLTGEPLPPEGSTVVASGGSGAVWTRAGATDRVRSGLPSLAADEVLRHAITDDRALSLIAIVEFLRALSGDDAYVAPPLRATMLFDDPNLRWLSYGHIRYPDLVRHADDHGYHAAMAMIPLDAWGQRRSAVRLFRERPDRVSLVMHGNDHRKRELFDQHDPVAALALGAQALRRVARFEATSRLRVGRVMVPPHGMCSQTMARALGRLPFDALCSIHPFPWTGNPPEHELLAGWGPATFPEGCSVIPRVEFSSSETAIALRAYIDHPIVLYGHHDDVAEGLEVLAAAAARVNRLGPVEWVSPQDIALSNVALHRHGDALSVHPYAHRVRVAEPASTITVKSPGPNLAGWSLGPAAEIHAFDVPVSVGEGPYEIRLSAQDEIDPADVPSPRRSVWPHLRRIATESRDRLAPIRRSA